MKKLLLSLLFISGFAVTGFGQIFSQNFDSSSTLGDYISATPNNGQFNSIGASNASSSVGITNNQLRLSRSAAANGVTSIASFSRTTDFIPAPTFLSIKFGLTLSGNTSAGTSAAVFQVGSNFTTGNIAEANSDVFARFFINITANDGQFTLRKLEGGTSNSATLSGVQNLALFINRTGAGQTYTAPDGSTENIATNSWDLWAGNTKIFDDIAALTAGSTITDFKFIYTGGNTSTGIGNIDIDNILINDQTTVLPVSLTSFAAKANLQNIDLAWNTASEKDNSHFEILRSGDGKTFSKIGEVKGAGTSSTTKSYAFIDKDALPGVSYYQLKQFDVDGKHADSEIVAVKSNVAASNFSVFTNRQEGTVKLTVYAANASKGTFKIYDLNGHKLTEQQLSLSKGYTNVSVPFNGARGLLVASLTTATEIVTQKFIQ